MIDTNIAGSVRLALAVGLALASAACAVAEGAEEETQTEEAAEATSSAVSAQTGASRGVAEGTTARPDADRDRTTTSARGTKWCSLTPDGGRWCCVQGPIRPICWKEEPGPIWTVK